ncbi:MAG TPA: acyltransferase [Flavobacterium sp.]|uniref:acyltransferase n=1 Tax=Flavobacterium sp. TaxID=239 RepID=UPI002CDB29EF|nr:acyltransferase [Flavobacterium sp.]HNP31932.1 acyltransferase [Flavobacterium sp.]
MIKELFQKMLSKAGKTYQIDDRIPDRLIYSVLYNRAKMLVRGYFKTGRKVFIGSDSKIMNPGNIIFGKSVTIGRLCILDGFSSEKIVLGDCVKIGAFSVLTSTSHFSKYGKGLKMGNNSAIGDYTHFGAAGGIEIGDDVIMGSFISFHSENHNFSDKSKLIREQGVTSKGIKLGNNIWVGAKVTFLDGCIVGNNSVVAAGAVVNGIFPDNVVIGGVPAKILKTIE